jgi:hypothetical protein
LPRAWPRTIWAGLIALGLFIGAVNLGFNDHPVWAGLLAVLGIAAAFASFSSGAARCLKCGAEFSGQFHLGSFNQCPACYTWHRFEQGQLTLVPADFIADEPAFGVSVDLLEDPTQWRLPWPGQCCVCGKSGTSTAEFRIERGGSENLLTRTVRSFRFHVGRCGIHKKGVDVWPGELKFRSHAYWADFCRTNRKNG